MWWLWARPRTVAVAFLLGGAAAAQATAPSPTVDVVFAATPQRAKVAGITWLCETWLPGSRHWPAGLDPRAAFRLTIAGGDVRIAADAGPAARDVVFAGSMAIGDGPACLFRCALDGSEDWFLPPAFALPPPWRVVLQGLDALTTGVPRTLATAVVVGHLAGGLAEADPRRHLLQLGATLCGDVTWLAWQTPEWTRVRGRSEGGLSMPAALVALASADGPPAPGVALRAYAARDADRAEATRQLFRTGGTAALPPLRAMLHADDATRLSAIDALVRRGAGDDLPAIVAAAGPDMPWATLAAADAVPTLWPVASPAARQQTRAALGRSQSLVLRAIDVDALAPAGPGEDHAPAERRVRALVWLALVGIGLTGLWARERARLAKLPA